MIRLALRSLLARRIASLLAALGLMTASTGFLLLTGTSRTTEAVLSGDIASAWSGPYHILVRPRGSTTALEQAFGLIRPNFLSGLNGGITLRQLDAVRGVSGVMVAAPIAVAGFTEWQTNLPVLLPELADPSIPLQLIRVRVAADAPDGSTYPDTGWQWALYAPHGTVRVEAEPNGSTRHVLAVSGFQIDCDALADPRGPTPGAVCVGGADDASGSAPAPFAADWPQPVVIAGIDPAAEAALDGLDGCVREGRYLKPGDEVSSGAGGAPSIPVLAAARSYLDEQLVVGAEVAGVDPAALAAGSLPTSNLRWRSLPGLDRTPNDAYQTYLKRLAGGQIFYNASSLWSVGDIAYSSVGTDHLAAAEVATDPSVFESQVVVGGGPSADAVPPEARDVWLRSISVHPQLRRSELFPTWSLVGTFDPQCLPGFSPLAGYRMETYAAPVVRLPNGETAGPTRNMAGYLNSPPLILTTLAGAAYLADPSRFAGAPGDAFISAIRVKVAGVDQPSGASEAKLSRVAADIEVATGLQVDIVAGSSPRQIRVDLPAGHFGRPAMTISEGWAVKGVAVRFIQALRAQDVAIFSVVLLSALILVAETAYISVRRRRAEFAVLHALGWSARRVGLYVEFEVVSLGFAAGLLSVLVSIPLAGFLGVPLSGLQLAVVAPLATVVAAAAGLIPALSAARASLLRDMRGTTTANPFRPRSVAWLALGDLVGARRTELLLGIIAATLAAVLIGGIALAAMSFAGTLDATLLGAYLSIRVQPYHWLIACLVAAVATLGLAQIATLNYLERQAELATLRALGWTRTAIAGYLLAQALAIGLASGLIGAVIVFVLSAATSAGIALGASSGALALMSGLGLSIISAVSPMVYAYRAAPAAYLRGE